MDYSSRFEGFGVFKTPKSLMRVIKSQKEVIVYPKDEVGENFLDFAVQEHKELEKISLSESECIRPIALYQAENINREFNVNFVKNYLIKGAKIPENEIAIATGSVHEFNGLDLFSRECPIRHIITVQALKEGWDLSVRIGFLFAVKYSFGEIRRTIFGKSFENALSQTQKFQRT